MPEMKKLTVLVVDDHPLMRAGISGEINAQTGMTVVAEAADGEEAIVLFKKHRPDVTLMDLRLPKASGIEVIGVLRRLCPVARIIVLTSTGGDVQALQAFKAGAVGYLEKDTLRKDLVETIRCVHAGMKKVPPAIAMAMAEHLADEFITPRELDVLRGVARGHSNKLIADNLDISEHTVKNHLKSILSKFSASDRTHAVMIALKRGILSLSDQ
jgi:DNA-binding NarL/FixJ family response regulator